MTFAKKGEYLKDEVQISDFARSLGHPARIAILKAIAENGDCITNNPFQDFQLSQSTIMQHLKELKRMGLIKGKVNGTKSSYCINVENFQKFNQLYTEFATELGKNISQKQNCERQPRSISES
jgi:DNA-binding transcriptional ArsR family regulator